MATNALMRPETRFPSLFDDFFRPWTDLFEGSRLMGRGANLPAVNIVENGNEYKVTVAAPGLKSEDFKIDVENNVITISAEKEDKMEEKDERYTRREYNYTSFSRSFTLPDDVRQDNIEANYKDGVLNLSLPKKEEARKPKVSKHVTVK